MKRVSSDHTIRYAQEADLSLLVELDGSILEMGESYWVKITATCVPPDVGRPGGIAYSLTLHSPDGERLVGFDNAHPVWDGSGPASRRDPPYDHHHRGNRAKPYEYADAATLLGDFWAEVIDVLREEGIP